MLQLDDFKIAHELHFISLSDVSSDVVSGHFKLGLTSPWFIASVPSTLYISFGDYKNYIAGVRLCRLVYTKSTATHTHIKKACLQSNKIKATFCRSFAAADTIVQV